MVTMTVLGLIIGLTMALTGAGGGILAVPALVFGLKLSVAEAGPVALFAVSVSAAFGASLGLQAGIVRYRAAGLMALAGVATSPLGLWTAQRVSNTPLAAAFGVVLAWVAVRTLRLPGPDGEGNADADRRAGGRRPVCARDALRGRFIWTAPCAGCVAACGLLAGFLSGLLGVGGGFVVVPALSKISDLPMRSIVATSLAVITLVSASGVIYATLYGDMQWAIALPFALAAVTGMLAGHGVAHRISAKRLRQMFGVLAAVVAVAMLYKAAVSAAG